MLVFSWSETKLVFPSKRENDKLNRSSNLTLPSPVKFHVLTFTRVLLWLTLFIPVCHHRGDVEPLAAGEQQPAGVLHNQRRGRAAGRRLLEGERLHQLHLQQRHHSVFLSALSRCQLQGARLTQGPVLPTLSRWVLRCRLVPKLSLRVFLFD